MPPNSSGSFNSEVSLPVFICFGAKKVLVTVGSLVSVSGKYF